MTYLCGWCQANQCDRRRDNHAPTCPCTDHRHKRQNGGEGGADERGFALQAWENGASPQGASTPAGSNHPSLLENERG